MICQDAQASQHSFGKCCAARLRYRQVYLQTSESVFIWTGAQKGRGQVPSEEGFAEKVV